MTLVSQKLWPSQWDDAVTCDSSVWKDSIFMSIYLLVAVNITISGFFSYYKYFAEEL